MALITSAASGDFSAGATWTGGVVPGVGDEARASTGHTITIDVDTTCDEVSNAGTGLFILASGVTLTANVTNKSTTTSRSCLQFTAASPAVGTIVGNCTGGTVSGAVAVAFTSTGTLTITGNLLGGTSTAAHACTVSSTGTLNLTGNTTGGSVGANFAYGINGTGNANINITGNAVGGTGTGGIGIFSGHSTNLLNITGNATGGSSTSTAGVYHNSTGLVTITGIATGGTLGGSGVNTGAGIQNNATGTVIVKRAVGNAFGPGNTVGLAATTGVSNKSTGIIELEELEFGQYGMSPIEGPGIRLKKVAGNLVTFPYVDAGAAKTLVDATQGEMPAESDVRTGVSYASGALTGTCAVPAAASVAFGVPVDATTGTAVLTPEAVANAVWDEVLTGATRNIPSSAGRRLRILDDERIIVDGQVQGATTNTVTLEPITTLCIGQTVVVTDQATGNKQVRFILSFDSDTNTATVDTQWCDIPTAGDEYQLTTVRSPLIARNDYPAGTIGAEINEMHLIQGLSAGDTLTVTPTSRTAGAVSQTIGGDGTTTTTVSRD
jgi:hypothetical protein